MQSIYRLILGVLLIWPIAGFARGSGGDTTGGDCGSTSVLCQDGGEIKPKRRSGSVQVTSEPIMIQVPNVVDDGGGGQRFDGMTGLGYCVISLVCEWGREMDQLTNKECAANCCTEPNVRRQPPGTDQFKPSWVCPPDEMRSESITLYYPARDSNESAYRIERHGRDALFCFSESDINSFGNQVFLSFYQQPPNSFGEPPVGEPTQIDGSFATLCAGYAKDKAVPPIKAFNHEAACYTMLPPLVDKPTERGVRN